MIGLGGVGLDVIYGVLLVLWISGRYKWRRHGFLPHTTGGGVSPCTESAVRLLIAHRSVVGLIKSCGGVCIGFGCFRMRFLLFIYVCGSPGGLLFKGGMM